ncbi:Crp/Fnr family transcriptional regulator [Labedaea rhizosphaerae]|nr:Crp/Fnr family transcriptional regulator [Labedaea rhizosphaerae]
MGRIGDLESKVLAVSRPTPTQANAAMLLQGNAVTRLLLVTGGHVRVHRAALANGPTMLLDILGAGDLVALEDLVVGSRSHATYLCGPKLASVRAISLADFARLRAENPRIEQAVVWTIATQLRERDAALALASHKVRNRVIMFLRWLAAAHGREDTETGAVLIDVGFTQPDIAAAVGAAPAQVSAVLSSLRDNGFIAIGYRSLHVLADLRKAVDGVSAAGNGSPPG